jgi:hypothetical protein
MSRRQVQKLMPISAIASSPPVEIGQTNAILSDPDGRWVAKRQGAINEAFEKRMRLESDQAGEPRTASHDCSQDVGLSDAAAGKLSGESDRIGRNQWDENIPFGEHVGFF